jgi:hypothetical protein
VSGAAPRKRHEIDMGNDLNITFGRGSKGLAWTEFGERGEGRVPVELLRHVDRLPEPFR